MTLEDYKKLSDEELIERINKAKKEKNAIILVHTYQRMNIHPVADFLGDSLALAQEAAKTDADMIVFCGVDFMAESAKILSPNKKVILPEIKATCPMAKMADAKSLIELKRKHPEARVITYINSSAAVKAESDIICTSSNAVKIVEAYKDKPIIFVPDKNLGAYCQEMTGADMIFWDGYCYVHNEMSVGDAYIIKKEYPNSLLLTHPEAPMEVLAISDFVGSTSALIDFVEDNIQDLDENAALILGTEVEIARKLQAKYPTKNIVNLAEHAVCATMKMTELYKVCHAIENEIYEIEVDEDVRDRALIALNKMLKLSK